MNEIEINRLLATGQWKKEEKYWINQLKGKPLSHGPLANRQKEKESPSGSMENRIRVREFLFSEERTEKLNRLCKSSKQSMLLAVLSGIGYLTAALGESRDVVLGIPVFKNKEEKRLNDFWPVVMPLSKEDTFKQYLVKIRNTMKEANENANYPIGRIVTKQQEPGGRNPYPILVGVQEIQNPITASDVNEIAFSFSYENEKLKYELFYHADYYTENEIERINSYFENYFDCVLRDYSIRLEEIEILSTEELKSLEKWNQTEKPLCECSIDALFEKQVEQKPDETALVYQGRSISFRQLEEAANVVTYNLKNAGANENEFVAVLLERSEAFVACVLGILKAGMAYIPIDPKLPDERKNFLLEDSKVQVLIGMGDCKMETTAAYLDYSRMEKPSYYDAETNGKSGQAAYMIYTSGSTGKPKGVVVESHCVVNFIYAMKESLHLTQADRFLNLTTVSFDIFFLESLLPVMLGAKSVIVPEEEEYDFQKIADLIEKEKVTVIQATPSRMRLMIQNRAMCEALSKVKKILVGGEVFPKSLLESLRTITNAEIFNMYGPTETTIWSSVCNVTSEQEITIGKPIANTRMYILGQMGNRQPTNVLGELVIAGQGVARGYYQREALTQEKFRENRFCSERNEKMYLTGDEAYWQEDGNIVLVGRKDNQVKINGYRVEKAEIEYQIKEYPSILEAVVTVKEVEEGKLLIAYIQAEKTVKSEELYQFLANRLPRYMIPQRFVPVNAFPLMVNGKIDRIALEAFKPENMLENEKQEYRTITELKLAEIYEEVLGVPFVDAQTDFFHMGGNSVLASKVVQQVYQKFQANLSLSTFFQNSAIHKLAQIVEQSRYEKATEFAVTTNKDCYPLSPAQMRIYITQKLMEDSLSYHMPSAMEVYGEFDLDRLGKAVRKLTAMYDILRTSFSMEENQIVQKLEKEVELPLEIIESGSEEPDEEIKAFVRRFSLEKAPLCRIGVWKQAERKYILLLDIHHIIADDKTVGLLGEQLMRLYYGDTPLDTGYPYAAYVNAKQQMKKEPRMKEEETYWVRKFQENMEEFQMIRLPSSKIAGEDSAKCKNSCTFSIDEEQQSKLKSLLAEQKVTLFMFVMSVYSLLQSKLTGASCFAIGIPMEDRFFKGTENMAGILLNTLAIKIQVKPETSFLEYLKQIKMELLEAYDNRDYDFEDLVSKLNLSGREENNPLFRSMLVMKNHAFKEYEREGLRWKQYSFDSPVSKYELMLEISEQDSIEFGIQYQPEIYEINDIQRFITQFYHTIQQVLDNPTIQLAQIEAMSEEEKKLLLEGVHPTSCAYPKQLTMLDFFYEQCEKRPEQIAVQYQGQRLTYQQLEEKAAELSKRLRSKGIKRESIVAVMMKRSLELIVSLLGIWMSGAAYLPIDRNQKEERKKFILEDSQAGVLLVAGEKADYYNRTILDVLESEPEIENLELPLERPEPGNLAYVIYTSGSTGKPKGVKIEHGSIVNRLNWMQKKYPIGEQDKILQKTPYTFDVSVWELFWWMINGSSVSFLKDGGERDPEEIVSEIEKSHITVLHFVPSMLDVFLDYVEISGSEEKLKTLTYVFASGEALSQGLVNKFNRVFQNNGQLRLINLYGPTEATVDVTYFECPRSQAERIPIGKPIDNTRIYIVDPQMKLCPFGVSGEICISGVGLAREYLNRKELTEEKFIANPYYIEGAMDACYQRLYKTGDIGKWLPDGMIAYLGRMDNQVKIHGIRVELGEIEEAIGQIDGVRNAVVLQYQLDQENKQLVAFLVLEPSVSLETIKRTIQERVASYMVPEQLIPTDSIPVTANGKVDRKKLLEYRKTVELCERYVEPVTKLENEIAGIWGNILCMQRIDVSRNFFDLGGNSILLIRLYNELEKHYPGIFKISDLFGYTTVQKLADFIETRKKTGSRFPEHCMKMQKRFLLDSPLSRKKQVFSRNLSKEEIESLSELAALFAGTVEELVFVIYFYILCTLADSDTVQIHIKKPDGSCGFAALEKTKEADVIQLGKEVVRVLHEVSYTKRGEAPVIPDEKRRDGWIYPAYCLCKENQDRKGVSNSDLCLITRPIGSGMEICLDYNHKRVKKETAQYSFLCINELIKNLIKDSKIQ